MSTLNRIAMLEHKLYSAEIRTASYAVMKGKRASGDLTPEVVNAFAQAFFHTDHSERVAFGGLVKKLGKLVQMFRRAPKLLQQIKEMLGDLKPRTIMKWAKDGLRNLKKRVMRAVQEWPLAMFFYPKSKLPTLTDMLVNAIEGTRIGAALQKVRPAALKIDKWLDKHPLIKGMSRPVLAAVFIWIWLNVAEISWDIPGIVKGFTGQIGFSDLLSSLPESGIGAIFASLGLGYHLLGPMLVARVVWLVAQNYIEYIPNKGFKVYWNKMGRLGDTAQGTPVELPEVGYITWSPA